METPESRLSNRKGLQIGQNAKRIREAKNLSIEFLAGEIGMEAGSYAQIEADQSVVSDELLIQLSKVLGVSVIDLLSVQYQTGHPSQSKSTEMERLERLYQEQINLLRDEISYLRNMLEAAAKKD